MNNTGEWGEIYACRYLRDKGYDILAANYSCRFGEADIIYKDKKTIVFVEVKARSAGAIASPAEFVTEQKQRKLAMTAAYFLKELAIHLPVRFDVAEVYFPRPQNFKEYTINYIKDAFRID